MACRRRSAIRRRRRTEVLGAAVTVCLGIIGATLGPTSAASASESTSQSRAECSDGACVSDTYSSDPANAALPTGPVGADTAVSGGLSGCRVVGGVVKDPFGEPLGGATVSTDGACGEATVIADEHGGFAVGVSSGDGTPIRVSKPGFASVGRVLGAASEPVDVIALTYDSDITLAPSTVEPGQRPGSRCRRLRPRRPRPMRPRRSLASRTGRSSGSRTLAMRRTEGRCGLPRTPRRPQGQVGRTRSQRA